MIVKSHKSLLILVDFKKLLQYWISITRYIHFFLSFAIRSESKDCKISIRWRHQILIPNCSWDGHNTEKPKTYDLWNQVCSVLPVRTERDRRRSAVEFSWRDSSLSTKKIIKWMQEYGGGGKRNSRDWGGQRILYFTNVPHTMKDLKIWKDPDSKSKGHTEIWTK